MGRIEQDLEYFAAIEPGLYRHSAIDPESFRRAVERIFGQEDEPAG